MNFNLLSDAVKREIRKAELAAWMHNIGKLSPEFVRDRRGYRHFFGRAARFLPEPPKTATGKRFIRDTEFMSQLQNNAIDLDSGLKGHPVSAGIVCMADLIEFHFVDDVKSLDKCKPAVLYLMAESHHQASAEEKRSPRESSEPSKEKTPKETPADTSKGRVGQPQGVWPWFQVSPFGTATRSYENEHATWLLQRHALHEYRKLAGRWIESGKGSFDGLKAAMDKGLADSQYPQNDVTVGDMGISAAALLKASIVRDLLGSNAPVEHQWRLMRVAVDGVGFVSQAMTIGDLLGRRSGLEQLFDSLALSLGSNYAVGSEIYRDENGVVFVIPQFEMPSEQHDFDQKLKEYVEATRQASGISGDISCEVYLSDAFAVGGISRYMARRIPSPPPPVPPRSQRDYVAVIGAILEEPAPSCRPKPSQIAADWEGTTTGHQTEPCANCQSRPIDASEKLKRRRMCEVCFKRRTKRVEDWVANPQTTVWLDEVSDTHGRYALLAGRFRLEPWLGKNSHIERTIFQKPPAGGKTSDEKAGETLTASMGRVRRVFETTHAFWQGAIQNFRDAIELPKPRIYLHGTSSQSEPTRNHAYEARLEGARISTVWNGVNLVVVENLDALSGRLGLDLSVPDSLANFFRGKTFELSESNGYVPPDVAKRAKEPITFRVNAVKFEDSAYSPCVELLSDPRQMFMLVPATDALNGAAILLEHFEREMAKVRNRLALDVVMIVAPSVTPLRAVMDAGRRALDRKIPAQQWKIAAVSHHYAEIGLTFDNGVAWNVPIRLPIAEQRHNAVNQLVAFEGSIPDDFFPWFEDDTGRIVHVTKLKPGLKVKVEPSTFEFEFLDSASRRFELAYTPQGRRLGTDRNYRPHELERVSHIRALWSILKAHRLSTTQMRVLDGLLHAKSQDWGVPLPVASNLRPMVEQFIEDVLRNLEWGGEIPDAADLDILVAAAADGLLQDCLEIHLGVLKSKGEND